MRLHGKKHLFRPVILFHVTDITEKILSDRNTCIVPLFYCFTVILFTLLLLLLLTLLLSPYRPVIEITWTLIDLNKNINRTYTGTGKFDGEDSVGISDGPRIHVQPSNGSTAGF